VDKDTSCNVYTFSDSRLTWFSQDISVYYWTYYKKSGVDKKTEVNGADFESGEKCTQEDSIAASYEKGLVMNYTGGMCGYKFQISNADTYYDNTFKVMKDGASNLLLGAAVAISAILAF